MKLLSLLCVVVLAGTGCKSKNSAAESAPASSSAASGALAAPDQLGSSELLEGKEQALGLPLPEGMKIVRQSYNRVRVRGPVSAEALANFVRKRVEAEVETGPRHTQFSRARLKAPVGGAHAALLIDISVVDGLTIADISLDPRGAIGPQPTAMPSADPDDDL